jgi:hypothetical protein
MVVPGGTNNGTSRYLRWRKVWSLCSLLVDGARPNMPNTTGLSWRSSKEHPGHQTALSMPTKAPFRAATPPNESLSWRGGGGWGRATGVPLKGHFLCWTDQKGPKDKSRVLKTPSVYATGKAF